MNKQHVEFALERWADAKGYTRNDLPKHNGVSGRHYYRACDGSGPHTDGSLGYVEINLVFCREMPINDEFKYVAALCEALCIPMRLHEMRDGEILAMHNATIDQRLAAYFAAEN